MPPFPGRSAARPQVQPQRKQRPLAGGGRGGHSGRVAVWNAPTGECAITVGEETYCVLAAERSPKNTTLPGAARARWIRVLFDRGRQVCFYEVKKHTHREISLEFSPDGVLLATGDRSSGLYAPGSVHGALALHPPSAHRAAITEIQLAAGPADRGRFSLQ